MDIVFIARILLGALIGVSAGACIPAFSIFSPLWKHRFAHCGYMYALGAPIIGLYVPPRGYELVIAVAWVSGYFIADWYLKWQFPNLIRGQYTLRF